MGHDEVREALGVYVLGALTPDERAAIAAHLETCAECGREIAALREAVAALPHGAPQTDPSPALRARILEAAGAARASAATVPFPASSPRPAPPRPGALWIGWGAAAAASVLAGVLGLQARGLQQQLERVDGRLNEAVARLEESERRLVQSEQRLTAATTEATMVRASVALLTTPDVVQHSLQGQAVAPQARARAFVSRSRGVLLTATDLPQIPADRTYQLWFLTRGAPVSAGLLRPDASGSAMAAFATPIPQAVGMAVSLEPAGGVPAPTGALYLVGQ